MVNGFDRTYYCHCGILYRYISRRSVSTKLRTLVLDARNANSIQEAVSTVKRLIPPSGGIYL